MDEQAARRALKQLVNDYAFDQSKGIKHRADPPEIAVRQLRIYGYALADAAEVLYGHIVSAEVYVETNRLLAEIDPDRIL